MAASLKPIIDPSPFSNKFFRLVDQLNPATRGAIRDALYDVGNESRGFMVRRLSTGPKTGRLRVFGIDKQASAPGEFPARITGKLVRNADYSVRSANQLEVGIRRFAGPRYPFFLEFGTRKMLRRPYIEPTSNQFANQLAVELMHYSRVGLSKRLGRRFLP